MMPLSDYAYLEQAHIWLTKAADRLETEYELTESEEAGDDLHDAWQSTVKALEKIAAAVDAEDAETVPYRKLDPAWDGSQPYGGV